LHPEDLKLRSLLGPVAGSSVADWPIRWEELEPYFERAEYEIGVSGEGGLNPYEPHRRPLPLPRLAENAIGKLIEQAGAELGWHVFPTARAILSRPWGGRSGCRVSHLCGSYGCASGAKSSTLVALLPKALDTGRCQVRPLSMVVRVEAQGDRAQAVQYLDAQGRTQRVAARVVVLACSPVETARLLLLSAGKGHPDGLGNASGQVGRNLMFLGFGAGECEFPRTDPRMRAIDWREPFVNRSLQDFYLIDRGKPTVRKGGTISFLFPHANPIYTAEQLATFGRATPLWGKPLKDVLRQTLRTRRLEFEIFAETLPSAASRVTLDPEIKDRFGLPVARFFVEQHTVDREVCSILVDRGLELMQRMRGEAVRATRRGQQTYWLQAGTCRFGDDPQTSVLDRDCRCHTVRNLFVTDGSFMPTSGGVPNTLTIEANALRVGDRIVASGKQHAL
jgi:choline dehydrogenase-like flavoprotein